ncbi:unnamed protein product [Trichobilharzia regenti]|nr:unnamed protein product [Trichobilharzia regenti]
MNLGNISDQLPTYPNNIQGELRLILQTKDIFLVCYKHLEEYRRLVNEQNRLITKEFVQEQLQIGEDEIAELKIELQEAENRLGGRLRHNELLADQLASLGYASLESGASVRHLALCRSPQMRKNMLAQRQGGSLGFQKYSEPRPPTHMIDNIALAIAEIHQEVRAKVKPLLDYYRDLFYLQLHFSLVLGQVCNYCMPLVTENIGLIDRIFFWSERPEFDLVRRAGDIGDRLKEIYTRAQTVLGVLAESVRFLQSKVELQKTLEQRFHERLDEQQKTKDKILRDVHATKQNMDLLEEENDRLVGSLVKVDPSFVDSRHFYELAEGGNLMGAKHSASAKDTGKHNAEDSSDVMNNNSPKINKMDTLNETNFEENNNSNKVKQKLPKQPEIKCSPQLRRNSADANNNKAVSLSGDLPEVINTTRPKNRKKSVKNKADKDLREKHTKSKKLVRTKSQENISAHTPTSVSMISDTYNFNTSEDLTPKPRKNSIHIRHNRSRSKSRKKEGEPRRSSSSREFHRHKSRRVKSSERDENLERTLKSRAKSSMPNRRNRDDKKDMIKRHRRSSTPEPVTVRKPNTHQEAQVEQPNLNLNIMPSLKAKILGRTKDLLEAALHRTLKSNSSDQTSPAEVGTGSSSATGRMEQEPNVEGVTSVSSFDSLVIADSPLGEPGMMLGSHTTPVRQLQKKNRRTLDSHKNKTRSNNSTKSLFVDNLVQQSLPALSTDVLLTETSTENNANLLNVHLNDTKRHKRKSSKLDKMSNDLGDFLTGTNFEQIHTLPSSSGLPSLT